MYAYMNACMHVYFYFLVKLRLEELNRKLKTGDVIPPEHER